MFILVGKLKVAVRGRDLLSTQLLVMQKDISTSSFLAGLPTISPHLASCMPDRILQPLNGSHSTAATLRLSRAMSQIYQTTITHLEQRQATGRVVVSGG